MVQLIDAHASGLSGPYCSTDLDWSNFTACLAKIEKSEYMSNNLAIAFLWFDFGVVDENSSQISLGLT